MVIALEPATVFGGSLGGYFADETTLCQDLDRTAHGVLGTAAVQGNGFHAGPAQFLLTRSADQVAVHRKLNAESPPFGNFG